MQFPEKYNYLKVFYITKKFKSPSIGLEHQHGRRVIVLDTTMAELTSCENTPFL